MELIKVNYMGKVNFYSSLRKAAKAIDSNRSTMAKQMAKLLGGEVNTRKKIKGWFDSKQNYYDSKVKVIKCDNSLDIPISKIDEGNFYPVMLVYSKKDDERKLCAFYESKTKLAHNLGISRQLLEYWCKGMKKPKPAKNVIVYGIEIVNKEHNYYDRIMISNITQI